MQLTAAMLAFVALGFAQEPARAEVTLDHGVLRIDGSEVPWSEGRTWLFEASPEAARAFHMAVNTNVVAPVPIAGGVAAVTYGLGAIVIGGLSTMAGEDGGPLMTRGAIAVGLGGCAIVGGSLALGTWGGNPRRRAVRAYIDDHRGGLGLGPLEDR